MFVVFYTASVLFIEYAYQFDTLADAIDRSWPKSWQGKLSVEDFGFEKDKESLVLMKLLAPTATFVICVLQLRLFARVSESQWERSTAESIGNVQSRNAPLLHSVMIN